MIGCKIFIEFWGLNKHRMILVRTKNPNWLNDIKVELVWAHIVFFKYSNISFKVITVSLKLNSDQTFQGIFMTDELRLGRNRFIVTTQQNHQSISPQTSFPISIQSFNRQEGSRKPSFTIAPIVHSTCLRSAHLVLFLQASIPSIRNDTATEKLVSPQGTAKIQIEPAGASSAFSCHLLMIYAIMLQREPFSISHFPMIGYWIFFSLSHLQLADTA